MSSGSNWLPSPSAEGAAAARDLEIFAEEALRFEVQDTVLID